MALIYLHPCFVIRNTIPKATTPVKYVAAVSAEQLSQYLLYSKNKDYGSNPFILDNSSFIQIDPNIQRGHADEFRQNLAQQKNKIENIRDTLLGTKGEKHAYLGSLIWNIRPQEESSIEYSTVQTEGKPDQGKIAISTKAIYLPDSAHRHFGIVEAYRAYCKNTKQYERFNKDVTFSVEIYNLDEDGERELFLELNSKQKRITAAKIKEVDSVTPEGRLKSKILTLDNQNPQPLFESNYEDSSNILNNHKLLTMSVFMNCITEMYTAETLKNAKEDDELAIELANYFCDFFYQIRDTFRVTVEINKNLVSISPLYNLYYDRIRPVVESVSDPEDEANQNQRLDNVVAEAKEYAASVRSQDKTNANPVLRALARLGRTIRLVPNWENVLKKIQASGFEKSDGRLFQITNKNILERKIGSQKADGTLNIQVQTHTITAIYDYLIELADLKANNEFFVLKSVEAEVPIESHTHILKRDQETQCVVRMTLKMPTAVSFEKDRCYVRVDNDRDWKEGQFNTTKKRIQCETVRPIDFTHPTYGSDISNYELFFRIKFPPYKLSDSTSFSSVLKITFPDFKNDETTCERTLRCQPE